jgi:uncharacterized repeat protein (TIGR03803 family)
VQLRVRFGMRIATLLVVAASVVVPTQAQTFLVLHSFTGADGGASIAGLTIDRSGNLYGTAQGGGVQDVGTAFKLTLNSSGWTYTLLHNFLGGTDGAYPSARLIFGPDGGLYSTTLQGGRIGGPCSAGCGAVFKLKPPLNPLGPWTYTVLYRFNGGVDGQYPVAEVIFDSAGNMYGTTQSGGADCSRGCGTVYELMPSAGGWTERILHAFQGGPTDGANPQSELIFDTAGNLYGTTVAGGTFQQNGTVYKLSASGSGWTENVLYSFQGTGLTGGANPNGGLIADQFGNLYAATTNDGGMWHGGGAVSELTPSGSQLTFNLVYDFGGSGCCQCGSWRTLAMDHAGNLYGTTLCGGVYRRGSVFELMPSVGGWTYASLHDFTGGRDGAYPISNLVFDAMGNLYGTASAGAAGSCIGGCGVVFEIKP